MQENSHSEIFHINNVQYFNVVSDDIYHKFAWKLKLCACVPLESSIHVILYIKQQIYVWIYAWDLFR